MEGYIKEEVRKNGLGFLVIEYYEGKVYNKGYICICLDRSVFW